MAQGDDETKPAEATKDSTIEEGRDDVARDDETEDTFDPEAGPGAVTSARIKALSDLTGFMLPGNTVTATKIRASRQDRRTVSDAVLFESLPKEAQTLRRRQRSTDVVKKFQQMTALGDADLRFAEEIAALGTRRERIESGISDMMVKEKIELKEEDEEPFEFNDKGLTTAEAEKLLLKYGKNELPEHADPLWLVFLRILIQPMVSRLT